MIFAIHNVRRLRSVTRGEIMFILFQTVALFQNAQYAVYSSRILHTN
jgi:hypothetical protein